MWQCGNVGTPAYGCPSSAARLPSSPVQRSHSLSYNRPILPPMRTRPALWMLLLLSAITSAQTKLQPTLPIPQFEDVAEKSGLTVPHISSPDKKYIVESMSGGVGLIDCDNDGKLDIITINGSTVERYRKGGDPLITLYHQDSDPHGNDL